MTVLASELITLGLLLLLAVLAEAMGRHTRMPRISLLILVGFLLGPSVAGLVDPRSARSFEFISVLALSMVGFLVGGRMSMDLIRRLGHLIMWVALWETLVTYAVVAVGVLLLGGGIHLALLLGAIGTATDPAATFEAIREQQRGSRFADVLSGIVAVDDAIGLIVFSITVLVLHVVSAGAMDMGADFLLHALRELFGALLLGVLLGLPMAYLSGRLRRGEPTLMEALGMVLLCAGLAQWLKVSHLLACVAMGMTVVNFARHHHRPFHAVEDIEWPFLALFFIFCGAYLTLDAFAGVSTLLLAYLLLRLLGRVLGGWLAAVPAWTQGGFSRWGGLAMLPQAGVALAMAFVAAGLYPDLQETLLPVVISATVLFELAGPLAARAVLTRVAAEESEIRAGPGGT
ncbi:cation:proton antiporter [Parahaliea maris]|uniref:Cation:proton antiporter n=1 Tax=Parahaliea maris TaxID=2716870 RepID=A0A5C9A4M3_9GAMM|nr:cation:proton antiporter [Parahaliea maris]TXS94161.1 cation:proton antiporter [Parahaliea maris]